MNKWLLYYWSEDSMQYVPCFSGTWDACNLKKRWLKLWCLMRSLIIVPRW